MSKSSSNNASQSKYSQIARNVTIALWLALILFIAVVLAHRVIARDVMPQNAATSCSDLPEGILDIEVADSVDNIVIPYFAHTVYFNPTRRVPNATIYLLTAEHTTGPVPRCNNFIKDDSIASCPNAWDYSNSGYDRGHMSPAGDMKWAEEAMNQSFLMTNICPQNHNLNMGSWNRLEIKIRDWAYQLGRVIVATGPIFDYPNGTIGKEVQVAVPTAFFKVIFSPDPANRRMIAFIMSNAQGAKNKLRESATTVDEVEQRTGLDFFSALDDDEEASLEAACDYQAWQSLTN